MLSILPLHENTHLIDDCVELLNDEWPRSKAARLHSVTKSCSSLPYSLVLVEDGSNVVGYCRLAKVLNDTKSVLVESVVVDKKRRGQGLGRRVMEMAEEHAVKAGFHRMYLCTKDKQGFYQHLGYSFCQSVNTLGAMMLETCDCSPNTNTPLPMKDQGADCKSLCGSTSDPVSNINSTQTSNCTNTTTEKDCSGALTGNPASVNGVEVIRERHDPAPQPAVAPPPPPPPPPVALSSKQPAQRIDWMVKEVLNRR